MQFVTFMPDPAEKWTSVDYGILVDKARLLREESTINLSGLDEVIRKVGVLELERIRSGK
jgi:hypothetical protein